MFLTQPITSGFVVTEKLVAGPGIEPGIQAYETCVLPLHYPAIKMLKNRLASSKTMSLLLFLHMVDQLFKVSLYFFKNATKNSGWTRTNGVRFIPSVLALNLEGAPVYH